MKRRNFLKTILVTASGTMVLGSAAAKMASDPQNVLPEYIAADWLKGHPRWPDYVYRTTKHSDHLDLHFITYAPFNQDPRYHFLCRETWHARDIKEIAQGEVEALEYLTHNANSDPLFEGIYKEHGFKFPDWALRHYGVPL